LNHDRSVNGRSVVEARGVSRRFGRRWAVADVTLTARAGEGLLIAGQNGSGKTTLLRILAGAIRTHQGSVSVSGTDFTHLPEELRGHTALLGHLAYTYEPFSAMQNLQLVARIVRPDADSTAILTLLERVGLGERADDVVASFSAGMRKRLAIARVILQASDAEVILLDEPYGNLDPPGFDLVDGLIEEWLRGNKTVIIASHQVERSALLCSEALHLHLGRVAWRGAAGDAAGAAVFTVPSGT